MNLSRSHGNILNAIVIVTIEKKLVSVNGYFRKGRDIGWFGNFGFFAFYIINKVLKQLVSSYPS